MLLEAKACVPEFGFLIRVSRKQDCKASCLTTALGANTVESPSFFPLIL